MYSEYLINRIVDIFRRRYDWNNGFRRLLISKFTKIENFTELNYLDNQYFKSKVYKSFKLNKHQKVDFSYKNNVFTHNFEEREVLTIENVVFDSLKGLVYVINKFNQLFLLSESTVWPNDSFLNKPRVLQLNRINQLKQLSSGISNIGFFHMIFENLPRAIYLSKFNSIQSAHFSLNSQLIESLNKTFKLNLIKLPRWNFVEKFTFIRSGKDLGYLHPYDLNLLKRSASELISLKKSGRMLYVSRLNSRRSNLPESKLEKELGKFGFEIVYPENMKLADQIKLFSEAKIVVGIHGAGLLHTIWGKKTKLIELMPTQRINRCFEWSTKLAGGQYFRIDYKPFEKNLDSIFHQIYELI